MSGAAQLSLYPPEAGYEPALYWLWLAQALGPANPHAGRVIDTFGGAQAAWEACRGEEFRRVAGEAAALRACQPDNTPTACLTLLRRCAAMGIRVLSYEDADYPLALARIPDLPPVLYCTGDAHWLNEAGLVGMVGSRKPTAYGVDAAAVIGKDLARSGAVIVSGLADGLDSEGHRAALKAGRPTVGVLGVPIDHTYPATNAALRAKIEQCGCVVSEYPPGKAGLGRWGFLQRNRLIAALSQALLVVEAQEKSGTMSTVAHAERYGRPVFAVPGSIFSAGSGGTNRLIREGRAKAAVCSGDLLEALGLAPQPRQETAPPTAPLPDTARRALACIGPQPQNLEALAEQSGLPVAVLLSALSLLKLKGYAAELPGKRYILR